MTRLAWLYALLLAFAAAWLGWGIAQGGRLQTDLTALLPADAQVDAVWRAADEAGEKQLNGQILLLVGSEDADRAFSAAEQVADRWQQSSLFAAVDSRLNPDLAQLRQEIRRLGVNALPREQQQLLLHEPAAYFQQRAEDAANPFAAQIVPLEDDWLGFARFVQQKQPSSRLQWHSGNGMMYSEQDGITWVWLRARLPEKAAADQAERLLPLLADSRAQAERGGYRLLAAGGALFAAEAKTQSERESGLMSAIGLSLTFALLLAVFRSPRVFALVLPLGAGMLLGAAAVVGAFGQIHILTVVIGTSLVGMLVDFPLHWLTPSVFSPDWAAKEAMRRVLPAFLAGLGITATGYLLLAFTPLPVLRQTAVFSVAAARAQVRADERRMLIMALSRATRRLLLTATADAEHAPSPFLTEIAHRAGIALTDADGAPLLSPDTGDLTLRGLVGELRHAAICGNLETATDTERRRGRVAVDLLADLARQGVSGADPATWIGAAGPTSHTPLVAQGERIRVSPSDVEGLAACPLKWFPTRNGGAANPPPLNL